jgi:disulfide bond formation protein DsbB
MPFFVAIGYQPEEPLIFITLLIVPLINFTFQPYFIFEPTQLCRFVFIVWFQTGIVSLLFKPKRSLLNIVGYLCNNSRASTLPLSIFYFYQFLIILYH